MSDYETGLLWALKKTYDFNYTWARTRLQNDAADSVCMCVYCVKVHYVVVRG